MVERQSARMPKITNDDLTWSGTGCFNYSCNHMATVDVKGLKHRRPILRALYYHLLTCCLEAEADLSIYQQFFNFKS